MSGDPFSVLGLPARFDLDPGVVERAYLARSARLHPDLARGDADAAREMAELNRARMTIADPERCADALLLRLGGPPRRDERALPPAFLMEIMDVREAVEAALGAGDSAARDAERARWERWAEAERARAIAEVGGLFAALPSPPPAEALRAIRIRLNAWRYIERLIEQLDPAYDPGREPLDG
ncbi:MAG: iron-sulfur cluster co-chaperone HscB C-terminal domain-containing protein [Phycisphaerales bacterium]